jgi:hypothetical protein
MLISESFVPGTVLQDDGGALYQVVEIPSPRYTSIIKQRLVRQE